MAYKRNSIEVPELEILLAGKKKKYVRYGDDAYINLPGTSLLLVYNPAQVLKLAGKRHLTGPAVLMRMNMDNSYISLTIDDVYRFQKYLENHSVTLMADGRKLPCICID